MALELFNEAMDDDGYGVHLNSTTASCASLILIGLNLSADGKVGGVKIVSPTASRKSSRQQ